MEAQECDQGGYCLQAPPYAAEKRHADAKAAAVAGENFMVEDLLDFSNDDADASAVVADDGTLGAIAGVGSAESSTVTAVDSCNSSFSGPENHFSGDMGSRNFADTQFSGDLCFPYDDLAELEWLSNFVEESFSSEDLEKLQLISGMKAQPVDEESETRDSLPEPDPKSPIFRPEHPVPGKARSKRSRAAPGDWSSRLLLLSPAAAAAAAAAAAGGADPAAAGNRAAKAMQRKEAGTAVHGGAAAGEGRKCLHCATDKTPQWRTGPMGPKTLCNACGVRYKSGRLVPEYRPASSPTFVLTKHSNSHRKVMELRRQKEMMRAHQHHQPHHQPFIHHHQSMIFDVSSGEDYLIHQHVGPDFRQLI